jgi:thimet oligopeptidase
MMNKVRFLSLLVTSFVSFSVFADPATTTTTPTIPPASVQAAAAPTQAPATTVVVPNNGEPSFTINEKELTKICNDTIAKASEQVNAIVASKDEATFENTVVAFENTMAEFDIKIEVPVFLSSASTSPVVRQASSDCEVAAKKFGIDIFGREDLYAKFQTVKASKKGRKLEGEDKKLMDDYVSSFLQSGLGVEDKEKKKQIKDDFKQMAELTAEFDKNIRDGRRFIQVDRSELSGMPEKWISGLKKASNGKYIITTAYPDYIPFMENAKSENARKRIYEQYSMVGGKRNVEILEKTLALREHVAKLMGFATHADNVFALNGRMVTSTGQVRTFVNELATELKPYLAKDYNEIKRLKCKETKCSDWDKVVINPWDMGYYINQMKKAVGDVDDEKVREYFPLNTVIAGMFQIYQTLLSLEFEKIPTSNVWHSTVEYYRVRDKNSHEVLGHFYLDLFPRDGKYNHAAVWGLIKPRYLGKGEYQKTLAAMLCNFRAPTGDSPSLLSHDEVETFFHEFGHVMADIVARTKYYDQGGDSHGLPRDFVEAPSQMLENWVWNPESLSMLSGHYKTGEKLPAEMLKKMIALKNVANGYVYSRQLFFATIDLDYHTSAQPINSTEVWNKLYESMIGLKPLSTVYPQASFGHLMGGYDAGYYGYMWAKVYAEDMFSVFEKKGILDVRTGMKYRKQILEPAGSQSVFVSLKRFLDRDPDKKAFLKSLGLDSAPKSETSAKK